MKLKADEILRLYQYEILQSATERLQLVETSSGYMLEHVLESLGLEWDGDLDTVMPLIETITHGKLSTLLTECVNKLQVLTDQVNAVDMYFKEDTTDVRSSS